MFHDESVGEKKVSLVVVKLEIKKDGVRLYLWIVFLCFFKNDASSYPLVRIFT